MRNKLWFLLALGFLTLGMNMAFAADDRTTQQPQSRPQQSMIGTIDKITDDKITLKTDDGKTRSFTINQAQMEEIKSKELRQGDHIDLMFNQQNQIVGVNKQNESNRDQSNPNRFNSNPDGSSNPNSDLNTNPNSNRGMSPNPNTSPSPNPSPNPGSGGVTPAPSHP